MAVFHELPSTRVGEIAHATTFLKLQDRIYFSETLEGTVNGKEN
jgi:hypothetical protein